jgi:DDE superfamily endonuclease
MTQRKIQYWVIPPKENAQFAANMENVLGIYKKQYDERFPVICMDEQPVQLLEEVNIPIAATKNHARRADYEYKRAGSVSIFMFCEPLVGWRDASVRPRRTKIDWAIEVRKLMLGRYGGAEKVTLVCDNLNTHVSGSFYEAFEPGEARSLLDRLDLQYTPKHGSWLNIAENELSSMTRQAMHGHRFATIESIQAQISAWSAVTNVKQRGVDWQFTIENARQKLKHLYPKVKIG